MKGVVAAAALAAAAGVQAQSISYSTVTIDDCPSSSYSSMVTVTDGVTVTYCPECEMSSMSAPTGSASPPPPGSASSSPPVGHTTVYTTTYMQVCPTGGTLIPQTYTITESCTESTPTFSPGPSYIPPGFTTTVKECTACAATPTSVTITEPCSCEATSGTSIGPGPTGPPAGPPGSAPPAPGPSGSAPGPGPSGGASTVTQTQTCTEAKCQQSAPPPPPGSGPPPPGGSAPPPPPGSGPPPPGGATVTATCTEAKCQHPSGSKVSQISDGQVQVPTGGMGSPMPSMPAGNNTSPPGPGAATTTVGCPGGTACPHGSSPSVTPYTAGGSTVKNGLGFVFYSTTAIIIGALALAL